jgi:hypothetical protein
MDVSQLKLEPIDFSDLPAYRWRIRRIVIGLLLFFYYCYALIFVFLLVDPAFFDLPESPSEVTSLLENPILLMVTFGFLGSVFFITRTFVRTSKKIDFPISWYLTRPVQGILMALFIYFAFRAGQFVFYSGGGTEVEESAINAYTLSILAIVAGMFTDQAYERLYAIALRIMKTGEEANTQR